jgi:hypothetical protein
MRVVAQLKRDRDEFVVPALAFIVEVPLKISEARLRADFPTSFAQSGPCRGSSAAWSFPRIRVHVQCELQFVVTAVFSGLVGFVRAAQRALDALVVIALQIEFVLPRTDAR